MCSCLFVCVCGFVFMFTVGKRSTSSTRPSECFPDAPGTAIKRGTLLDLGFEINKQPGIRQNIYGSLFMRICLKYQSSANNIRHNKPIRNLKIVPLCIFSVFPKLPSMVAKEGNLKGLIIMCCLLLLMLMKMMLTMVEEI